MHFNVRVRSFALLGILVVAACTDNSPTALISKTPLLRRDVGATTRRGPTHFANNIKYRDNGLKNARGRAGTAADVTLEARALLGSDGNTTLDISTGAIDAPDASRLLNKIQLKQFAPNGVLQTTTNYKDIASPVYQLSLAGRVRGSKLGVQSNLTTLDGSHSDVVSLTETVKLRPDVSVDHITAPAQSQLAVPVEISALISENNGDVGARADCVLSIDGVEAHRARGIWVDAGRSVSCLFSHVFPTTGTKQLTVSAVLVNPGDWSASNNSAGQSIQIVLPRNEFTWDGVYISQRNFVGTQLQEGYFSQLGIGDRFDYRSYWDIRHINTWVANVRGHLAPMAGPLTFTFRDEIDGKLLTEFASDPSVDRTQTFGGTYEDPDFGTVQFEATCTDSDRAVPIIFNGQEQMASSASVRVCTWQRSGPSGPLPEQSYTDFEYVTAGGDVSYYAEEYANYEDGTPEGTFDYTFTFNGDVDYLYGNVIFGNDYKFTVKISGSDQSKTASGTIHGTTTEQVTSQPYYCYDFNSGPVVGRNCSALDNRKTVTQGIASGTPE